MKNLVSSFFLLPFSGSYFILPPHPPTPTLLMLHVCPKVMNLWHWFTTPRSFPSFFFLFFSPSCNSSFFVFFFFFCFLAHLNSSLTWTCDLPPPFPSRPVPVLWYGQLTTPVQISIWSFPWSSHFRPPFALRPLVSEVPPPKPTTPMITRFQRLLLLRLDLTFESHFFLWVLGFFWGGQGCGLWFVGGSPKWQRY